MAVKRACALVCRVGRRSGRRAQLLQSILSQDTESVMQPRRNGNDLFGFELEEKATDGFVPQSEEIRDFASLRQRKFAWRISTHRKEFRQVEKERSKTALGAPAAYYPDELLVARRIPAQQPQEFVLQVGNAMQTLPELRKRQHADVAVIQRDHVRRVRTGGNAIRTENVARHVESCYALAQFAGNGALEEARACCEQRIEGLSQLEKLRTAPHLANVSRDALLDACQRGPGRSHEQTCTAHSAR